MHPLLTFASGVIAGIVGVKLLKSSQVSNLGGKAQSGLRDAALSSLNAVEKSSASLRAKLAPAVEEPEAAKPENEAK